MQCILGSVSSEHEATVEQFQFWLSASAIFRTNVPFTKY